MIPLYTPEQFSSSKSREKLPLECKCCKSTFHTTKNEIQKSLKRMRNNNPRRNELKYCSPECSKLGRRTGCNLGCKQCGKTVYKKICEITNMKNNFCSSSCSAIYNNQHKTTGTRRSKLEKWIEEQLTILYPNLEIHFNKTSAVNAELDIFIPSLKLAFELNGIFHYEPIYSEEKLNSTQNNDKRKFQACLERGIELCIIDTSSQKRFCEKSSEKYLNIIQNIINKKLGVITEFESA